MAAQYVTRQQKTFRKAGYHPGGWGICMVRAVRRRSRLSGAVEKMRAKVHANTGEAQAKYTNASLSI